MISVRNLDVCLEGKKILQRVSFTSVQKGMIAIMGPSGCGKSTLLKAFMGIHSISNGEIHASGRSWKASEWTAQQTLFTLVPQVPMLLPWKTVLENVAIAGGQVSASGHISKAKELLSVVGLSDSEKLYPWQISQGMAARVSFARTQMMNSPVLLLDEPFAAIDATTRFKLHRWLLEKIDELNLQAMIVTHDPREALLLADKIVILGSRPATVLRELDLPPLQTRKEPDWIFGPDAGKIEREIRSALDIAGANVLS
ncbi:ABC transporter ATP-binding protein [bacterium]|nr:ABC transporter ATP-binding protein [bacterium]